MRRASPGRRWPMVMATALAVVGLAACDGVGEQARDAVDDVRSEAGVRVDEARSEAEQRVDVVVEERLDDIRDRFGGSVDTDRVCQLVADDRLTGGERDRLEVAVELGEALGLPEDLTRAARAVLETTDGATNRVEDLTAVCNELGARLEGG